jgi:hypothetical protein
MNDRKKATLVLPTIGGGLIDWSAASKGGARVIEVWNLNLLQDSLHFTISNMDVEVVRVILDQSVDADRFLDFLSRIPAGFRGDILFIASEDRGFLSAVGRRDERVIYRLGREDVLFYLRVSGLAVELASGWERTQQPLLAMAS